MLEGQSRLESTLEVMELMKLQQDVKILKNVLLTKHQQKLMALQRLRTITFNDTYDSDDYTDKKVHKQKQVFKFLKEFGGK